MRKLLLVILLFGFSAVSSQERLVSGGQIPILAWYSIPQGETTVARYQELKDAGITYSLSNYPNVEAVQKALDVAAKVGIKMVVSCPELRSDPEKTVRRFMDHAAVAGYHLQDEPSFGQLKGLGEWGREIQAIDKKTFAMSTCFRILQIPPSLELKITWITSASMSGRSRYNFSHSTTIR